MTRLAYFMAYDVRGIVPEEIDATIVWRLGRALPGWAGAVEFVVGREARLSSPALAEALIRGLVEAGAHERRAAPARERLTREQSQQGFRRRVRAAEIQADRSLRSTATDRAATR